METLKEQYPEINRYTESMEQEKEKLLGLMVQLQSDNRRDEAVFEKIRLNVYNILLSYLQASIVKVSKQRGEEEGGFLEAFCQEYLACFDKVEIPWQQKLDYAAVHDILEDKITEEIKLETARKIRGLFISCMESVNFGKEGSK